MSRVGKHEIILPAGIVMSQVGNVITLKGRAGTKDYEVPDCINFEKTEKGFFFLLGVSCGLHVQQRHQFGLTAWVHIRFFN
mgnify:CR=1 FL=1